MKFKNSNSHLFALYFSRTGSLGAEKGKSIVIEDKELHHRIAHVLRFDVGSHCIFFDKEYHADIVIEKIQKKLLEVTVTAAYKHQPLSPDILLLLPVLKRQALSEAVYAAVEAGVSAIQLVATDKVQRAWGGQKELERLQAVIIAACEQAKYFNVPELNPPIPLEQALLMGDSRMRIYYDAAGAPLTTLSADALHKPIAVLVGPEGDLTCEEKAMLKRNNFIFTRLTPTILRSPQAVAVGIGMLRSLQYKISFVVIFMFFFSAACMEEDKKNNLSIKLHHALQDKDQLEEVEGLLKEGANPNMQYSASILIAGPRLPIAHGLLLHKTGTIYYSNALHAELCYRKSLACVSLLCAYDVDVNQQNHCLQTPCHLAMNHFAEPDMPDIMSMLVRRGADLGLQDNQGNTVFHYIAAHNNLAACSLLIAHTYEHDAIKTFLLIHKRNRNEGKAVWLPKLVLAELFKFAYPGTATYTQRYGYKKRTSISEILAKKNKRGLTAYDWAVAQEALMQRSLKECEQEAIEHYLKTGTKSTKEMRTKKRACTEKLLHVRKIKTMLSTQ